MSAAPRHPRHDYRCSLPGLTEFTVLRREGTDTATIDVFIIRCSGTGGNGENTLRNFYRSGGLLHSPATTTGGTSLCATSYRF